MRRETGKRKRKECRVAEYLRDTLLPLPHGARLPGLRDIMANTGAGRVVVSRVLRELRDEGLIRVESRSGIRRVDAVRHSDEIRLLHWQTIIENLSFTHRLFRRLTACAEAAGMKISIEKVGSRQRHEVLEELCAQGISRCIVYGAQSPEWASDLKPRMNVCLELLPKHLAHVTTELRNSFDMTAMQLDYLLKRGCRRIGYLHCYGTDPYNYPLQTLRLMDFYRIMAENGLRVDPAWVFRHQENVDDIAAGMTQIMNAAPPPEALILPGGFLGSVYRFCREHKIRIGEDLALFCCDDINENLKPEPTTITNNPETIAETFWEMLESALRGEPTASRDTKLLIRVGQTVPGRAPERRAAAP